MVLFHLFRIVVSHFHPRFCFLPPFSSYFFFFFLVRLFRLTVKRDSALGCYSGRSRLSAGRDSSPAQYPSSYDISTYLREYQAYLDIDRFAWLPSARDVLTVPFGVDLRDTATEA